VEHEALSEGFEAAVGGGDAADAEDGDGIVASFQCGCLEMLLNSG
jgi:hypothetical protein